MHPISIEIWKRRVAVEAAFADLFMFSQFTEVALIEKASGRQAAALMSDLFYPGRVTDYEIERYQNGRRQLNEEFPQALRIAILGLTHSAFETQIVAIARLFALRKGVGYRANSSSPIWAAKAFLEGLCAVATGEVEDWSTFKAFQSVRNAFIHNDGRVDLPLHDGSNPQAAASAIGAELAGSRIVLTRSCAAGFAPLCRRICMTMLPR